MARQRLVVRSHLSNAELKARYRQQRDAKEGRRWQALWLVSTGRSAQEAAAAVGFDVSWVRAIIRRSNAQGPASVVDGHRTNPGGPPLRLPPAQQEALRTALASEPPGGGLWSGPRVAAWMTMETGRPTCPQVGWVYLRRLGHTRQVPRPRHPAAAPPEDQAAFKPSSLTR
jgi:transposase